MVNKLNESQSVFLLEWGAANDIVVIPNDTSKDIVRKHEQSSTDNFWLISNSSAASTTKKIVENSVASFKKLAGFDSMIN